MKKLWIMLILLIIAGLTTGCGLESEAPPREPLDVSQWPTPVPPTPALEPTPFPKSGPLVTPAPSTEAAPAQPADLTDLDLSQVDLSQLEGVDLSQLTGLDLSSLAGADLSQLEVSGLDLATITNSIDLTGLLASNSTTPPVMNGDTTALLNQASALSGLSPVAVMKTAAPETTIRRGPGTDFGAIKTVEQGELGAILGTNAARDWLYIITITNVTGWIPATEAKIVGSLAEAPVLPNDPVAAFAQRTQAAANPAPVPTVAPLNLSELEPVATALVSSGQVNLRQRPGPEFATLGMLPANTQVAILGLNRDKMWALVSTAAGESGWVSLDHLDVTGSLANAPQYRTLEPVDAAQPAPIIPASGGGNPTAAPAANTAPPAPAPATEAPAPAPAASNLPGSGLQPVAAARVNTKIDLRSGPGEKYGGLAEATVDLAVEVLAVNPTGDWAVVRAPNSKYGWVPVSALSLTDGTLENAQPVFTGLVTSNNLPVLDGPGIYYHSIGLVNKNDLVSVQAINPGRNWILIEAASGVRGWIQLRLVSTITTTPDELPVVTIDAVAQTEQQAQAGPAAPTPSGPPSGKMVIQLSSGGQIMGINADGSGLTPLTHGIDPVLSPDGRQLAFTRWEGEIGTLWVANADGSGERAILGEMVKAKGPDWSPDGQQLVLNFQRGGRMEEEETCKGLNSNIPFRIAMNIRIKFENGRPVGICYVLPIDPLWTLRTIDRNTAEFKDVDGGRYAFRPAWDPNQAWRIVSDSGSGLVAVDINRAAAGQSLTDIPGDGSPVFSPDGRFIALVSRGQDGANIFRTNADGSGRVRLTQTPLWEGITPDTAPQSWNNVAPAWSPDGSRLAFLTDRTGRWEIWLMNADGSDQHPMFSDEVNQQLSITYDFNDERVISWR